MEIYPAFNRIKGDIEFDEVPVENALAMINTVKKIRFLNIYLIIIFKNIF